MVCRSEALRPNVLGSVSELVLPPTVAAEVIHAKSEAAGGAEGTHVTSSSPFEGWKSLP